MRVQASTYEGSGADDDLFYRKKQSRVIRIHNDQWLEEVTDFGQQVEGIE